MIACYDFMLCPPTYDAVAFLALAELERLRRDEEHVDVRVLPGPLGGFRRDGFGTWPHTAEGRAQTRDNIVVPLCYLLPSVNSVSVEADRAPAGWGKDANYIGFPRIMEALRAGSRPLRGPEVPVVGVPGLVTFTLREATHHPLRNSRVDEWIAAASTLRARGLRVMVVRDAQHAQDYPWIWDDCSPNASINIQCRSTLYRRAALNVGISNGPMWMSIFMNAPTLMLRPTTNAAGGCYDDAFYARFGLPRGAQLPTSPPHQRLVWEDDTRENIVRAVEEMLELV